MDEIEELDLVAMYEQIEQEQLKLLLDSNLKTEDKDQIVEIVDDTVLLYKSMSFDYDFVYAKIPILIEGFDKGFKISFFSNRYYYKLDNNKLVSCNLSNDSKQYPFEIFKQVYDLFIAATFDIFKEIFELYLNSSDYSFNVDDSNRILITIRLRDIDIKNDYDKQSHRIVDIVYKLVLSSNNFHIVGARPTRTKTEKDSGYTHSHFSSNNTGHQHVCLGSGIMNGIITSLCSLFFNLDIDKNRLYLSQYISAIESMAKYEDENGGPYMRYKNIKASADNLVNPSANRTYLTDVKNLIVYRFDSIINSAFDKKWFRMTQYFINNKKEFVLVFDKAKTFELLEFLEIHRVVLNQNNDIISSQETNQNDISKENLSCPIYWKNKIIRHCTIINNVEKKDEILSYPPWLVGNIYSLINVLINQKLLENDNKKQQLYTESELKCEV